jgi:hypothetical protein
MKIVYELGDKVEFNACYKKSQEYVDVNDLTEEQSTELDDNGYVKLIRQQKTELDKPLVGIVCGIRSMVIKSEISLGETCEGHYVGDNSQTFGQVLLVAVNMNSFYRVNPEWVKILNG